MEQVASILVEFFGIPRLRAGRAELRVGADTIGGALEAVERACPGLAGMMQGDGHLAPQYLICVNGLEFGRDLARGLEAGDRLLLLSADAGG